MVMQRAINSRQWSRSARVYATTVGFPCEPLEAWTRAIWARGTASSPNG